MLKSRPLSLACPSSRQNQFQLLDYLQSYHRPPRRVNDNLGVRWRLFVDLAVVDRTEEGTGAEVKGKIL